jgi:hypothetical protein
MPGAEKVGERDIVGLVVVHTRLHIGPAAYQSLKNTKSGVADPDPGFAGTFLTLKSGIQVPGWVKHLGSGLGSNDFDIF